MRPGEGNAIRRDSGVRLAQKLAIIAAVIGVGVLVVVRAEQAARPPISSRFTRSDPLNERALAQLGFEADRQAERTHALVLIGLAGRMSWRDPQVQAWLLQRAIEAGEWDAAMAHADALLRIDGDGVIRGPIFRLLDVMAASETSRPALVQRLRSAPWWRGSWLTHLAEVATAPAGAVGPEDVRSIVMALGTGAGRLSAAEYLPYVDMRIAHGDYAAAQRDWSALARRPDVGALLHDRTFQTLGGGAPFDWRRASGVGVSSDIEAVANDGRALRVDYDGVSPAIFPGQLLVLPPGRYSFAWRERISGPPRLAWRVRCLGPSPRILAEESPVEAAGWRADALAFETAQDCGAQELELIPLPGERREEVTGWFAGLTLSRTS